MLATLTSKNQLTIPKKIIEKMPDTKYFDLEIEGNTIVMKPLTLYETDLVKIREKMKSLDLSPDCVSEAVAWARSK
jgi:bifunctional DNA-binding transcriptional regulator/antitoxin component of YhaV-PrlF toxin-antitoxin module